MDTLDQREDFRGHVASAGKMALQGDSSQDTPRWGAFPLQQGVGRLATPRLRVVSRSRNRPASPPDSLLPHMSPPTSCRKSLALVYRECVSFPSPLVKVCGCEKRLCTPGWPELFPLALGRCQEGGQKTEAAPPLPPLCCRSFDGARSTLGLTVLPGARSCHCRVKSATGGEQHSPQPHKEWRMVWKGAGAGGLLCSSTIFLGERSSLLTRCSSFPQHTLYQIHFSDLTLCKHNVVLQALKGNLVLKGLKAHVKLKTTLGINIKN